MAKVLRCRDIGMNCDHIIRADTEDEVLKKSAEHARKDHGMKDIPKEVVEKVRAALREE